MKKETASRESKALTVKEVLALNPDDGKGVTVRGMLYAVRDMGTFAFLILRKGDGLIQCVYDKDGSDAEKEMLREESAVEICGSLNREERAPGGIEILVRELKVLSSPKAELPFSVSKRNVNISLENEIGLRPVTLRNDGRRSLFKVREGLLRGFRRFLEDEGFTEIITPKIVSSGAEGGANIFKLDYFGKKAFLAQSPQFYKQMLIPVYERVFEIAPVFRAEKHNTVRHLNEYISVDFEMGFIDSFYDLIEMEMKMLHSTFRYLEDHYGEHLAKLKIRMPEAKEIPCIRFSEAKERVSEKYGRKIRDPYDLEPEEERLISKLALEEYGSELVFVTHYPVKKRPFYAMDDPQDGRYTLSFDLLFRGLEITTGGQRIHVYDQQVEKMQKKGLDPVDFESYLMLHKYGCPPHGGLGMGLERFLLQLIEGSNIRAASMFPRDTLRITP